MLLKQLLGPSDFTNGAVTARFPTEGAIAITILNQSNFFYQAWADDSNLVGLINPWQRLVIRLTRREQNITLVPLANQPGPSYPQSSIYIGQLPEAPSIDMVNRYEPSIVSATGNKIVELTGSLPAGSNLLGSIGSQIWNGIEWVVNESSSETGDGDAGYYFAAAAPRLWNGSSYDRQYNNTQGTLLASATRTAPTISPAMINYNSRYLLVYLDITVSSGTGGLDVRLVATDPTASDEPALDAPLSTKVTATGAYVFAYALGLSDGGPISGSNIAKTTNIVVPRSWQVNVNTGDSSSYTYSVGYALIN